MTTRSEIETRLATWAATQYIPVAYEDVKFVKPTDGPWLEIIMLASTRKLRNVEVNGYRELGMFQINCYYPLGSGMGAVEALSESVCALYPVLPKTGTVSIEQPLNPSVGIPVDAFMCIPITGRYRVET